MTLQEAIKLLKTAGTAQNRKVYKRHGIGDKMFGVSFANLKAMQKRIKTDQELAERLWATGNHDARVLATMVADPAALTDRQVQAWVKDLDNYVITDSFASLVSQTPHARKKMEQWTASRNEWIGRAGWNLVIRFALETNEVPDRFFESYMKEIEKGIHARKNYVRDAMNGALIAIGIRTPKLEKAALAAAKRIGKVQVDHGETNCKTPDAAEYIRKTLARRQERVRKSA